MEATPSVRYFVVALCMAVVLHVFIFQAFVVDVSVKDFPQDHGVSFLGSILNSSQMKSDGLLKTDDPEPAPFSFYVPKRSEAKYFSGFKDVAKPQMRAVSQKNEAKSLFFINAAAKASPKSSWKPAGAAEYQPLKFP